MWKIENPNRDQGDEVCDFKWKWWHDTKTKRDADATPATKKKKGKKDKSPGLKRNSQKKKKCLIVPQSTWVKGKDGRQLVVGENYTRGGEREICLNPFRKGVRIN